MKKLTVSILAFVLTTASAFAQDYLNCGFRIADNKPDCPFLGKCPQEKLKVSKSQLFLELNEGDTKEGKISLKKVVLLDGDDKEKKDVKITVFGDDENLQTFKKEKVKHISFDSRGSFDYNVQKAGNTFDISFTSPIYKLQMSITGDFKVQDYLLTEDNAILVVCERLSKNVYNEFMSKKEALNQYKKEKSQSQGATKQ
jgi:hypothetical protein